MFILRPSSYIKRQQLSGVGHYFSDCACFSEIKDKEPCYDTSTLHWEDFSDWTHGDVPLQNLLRFISLQAHVIHKEDPKVSSGCLQLPFQGQTVK